MSQQNAAPSGPYGGTGSSQGSSMHLWDYWAVVLKHLPVVLVFVAIATATAWFYTRNQQKLYRATAVIELTNPAGGDGMPYLTDERYLQTKLQLLLLPSVLENAVTNRDVVKRQEFSGKSVRDVVRMAAGRVTVSPRRNSNLIDVSVEGPDKLLLEHVANALVEEFRDMQISEAERRRKEKADALDKQLSRAQAELKLVAGDKRTELERRNITESQVKSEIELLQRRRSTYISERDDVERWLIQNEPIVTQIEDVRKSGGSDALDSYARLPFVQLDAGVRSVQDRVARLNEQMADLLDRQKLARGHREVLDVQQEIDRSASERRRIIEGIVNSYLLQCQMERERHRQLGVQFDGISKDLQALNELDRRLGEFNEQAATLEGEIEALRRQSEILLQQPKRESESVRISEYARTPETHFAPKERANILFGVVLGVAGGIALAFFLDYLDDTIRTKDELQKIADVPLLGIIPRISARQTEEKDLYAHAEPKSPIAEAYRGVRTSLTLSTDAKQLRVLLVTSAGPREGKTTTSINLATVLAYAGAKVLLIDADMRRPRVHKSLGLPNTRGLSNVVVQGDDAAPYCLRSSIEGVDFMPSGPIPPNPSELLGHQRMRDLLASLRQRYDHVIIDTPPIGAVTDAAVLGAAVDGVILVVHAGKTRRGIVSRGLEQLSHVNARLVGVILNNLRAGGSRYHPGYYQTYAYYQQYAAEEASSKAK
ncbi:MAG: hypothetical protein HMLKMBBP_01694 [Planctomycetes bacterium]|nr:hypothetical protein [Planctomycetota bacterium]